MEIRSTKISSGSGDGKHCGLILDAEEEESGACLLCMFAMHV